MIRSSLLALAALGVCAAPMTAAAASADPALNAFQSICVTHANNYSDVLTAAAADGWTDTQLIPTTDDGVSITSKAAKEKTVGTTHLTLLVSTGLRHTKTGDIPEGDCKVSTDSADPTIVDGAKSWLGFAPDSGDATLAVFYVKTGAQPTHIPPAGLNAALAAGGFSVIKAQQDQSSAILVYTSYSK